MTLGEIGVQCSTAAVVDVMLHCRLHCCWEPKAIFEALDLFKSRIGGVNDIVEFRVGNMNFPRVYPNDRALKYTVSNWTLLKQTMRMEQLS